MDGSIILIKKGYRQDESNQFVESGEEKTEIFAEIKSITRTEFSAAGVYGMKPEVLFKTPVINYDGQTEIEYNNERYDVYRTFIPPDEDDYIELYAKKKVGKLEKNRNR